MRFLHALRELLRTWQGIVLGVLAVVGAIYYGPKKMLETWDWYWDRFRDNEVFLIICRRKLIPKPGGYVHSNFAPPPPMVELPFFSKEIADYLKRKEPSVQRSLTRLRRRGKIEPYQDGWRLRT
jgi:hypothetical protein